MNKDTCDFIFNLCANKDDKTLDEISLKRAEELGELCREVLILSQQINNRNSVKYRFPYSKERIQEEAVDFFIIQMHMYYKWKRCDHLCFSESMYSNYQENISEHDLLVISKEIIEYGKQPNSLCNVQNIQYLLSFLLRDQFWSTLERKLMKWNNMLT